MELAPEKQKLHAQQRNERAELLDTFDRLQAEYHKEQEHYRRQRRKKAFNHEITRARRYHEEKSFWEYLNNIVEDIHLFTWSKTVTATCTANYQQQCRRLEQKLRELDAQHRKERITLRYDLPAKSEERGPNVQPPEPHGFLP